MFSQTKTDGGKKKKKKERTFVCKHWKFIAKNKLYLVETGDVEL